MAHFYGTVKGSKGETSRVGGKPSGLRSTCNGWNLGIETRAEYQDGRGRDIFRATFDSGSGNGDRAGTVDYFIEDGRKVVEPSPEFLLRITDNAWQRAIAQNSELVRKLHQLIFLHMDKL